ncbi:MAG: metallophosphoesterase [Deltaproteobacteria bacterium]|nr:metallophosphoesterase [Deltaproteobacteria bacterium]
MVTWRAKRGVMTSGLVILLAAAGCGDDETGRQDVATSGATDTATSGDGTATTTTVGDTSVAPDTEPPPDTTSVASETVEDSSVAVETSEDTSKLDVPTTETTTPPPEVRFIVMGDTGEGNDRQKKVAQAIVGACSRLGCDHVMLTGDNIYDAGVEGVLDAQWQSKFEVPYKDVDLPFYAVLGNHDNGGFLSQVFGDTFGGAGAEFERGDHQVAYSQVSEKWKMPDRVYDWVAGPAHFFALDTNDMVWGVLVESAEQRVEIVSDTVPALIDESTATWKIAFGHHPYRSNGRHGNAGSYEGLEEDIGDLIAAVPIVGDLGPTIQGKGVKEGLEAIVCGRVDIYFSGHDHNRQWFPEEQSGACAGTTLVVSGAGAKLTEFKKTQPTLFQDDQKAGFFWVHLKGKQIFVEAIDEDGQSQWTYQGEKP